MPLNDNDNDDTIGDMQFHVVLAEKEEESAPVVMADADAGPEIDPADRSSYGVSPVSASQVDVLDRQLIIDVIPEEEEHNDDDEEEQVPKPSVATQTSPVRTIKPAARGGSLFVRCLNPLKKLYKRSSPPITKTEKEEEEEVPSSPAVTEFTRKDLIIQEVVSASSSNKHLAQAEPEATKKEAGLVVDTNAANDEDKHNEITLDVMTDANVQDATSNPIMSGEQTSKKSVEDTTPTIPTKRSRLARRLARGVTPLAGCGCNKRRSATPHPQQQQQPRRVLTLFQRSRHTAPVAPEVKPATTEGKQETAADDEANPPKNIDSQQLAGLAVLSDISGPHDDLVVSEESTEAATESSTAKDENDALTEDVVERTTRSTTEEQKFADEDRTGLVLESWQIPKLQKYGVWSGMKMYAKSLTIATGGKAEEKEESLAEIDDDEEAEAPRLSLNYDQIEALFADNKGFSPGMKMYSRSIQAADEWAQKVQEAEEAARAVVEAARVEEEAKVEEEDAAVGVQDEPKAESITQVQSIDYTKESSKPCRSFTGAFGSMYQQFASGTFCSFHPTECLDNMHERACPRDVCDILLEDNSVKEE